MSMSDPVADLLTRIRNANMRNKDSLELLSSRMKLNIVKVLKDEGFITNWELDEKGKFPQLRIWLKYVDDLSVIREIKRISKPGLRLYTKGKDCKPVLNGQGISILSTSKGIMSDRQCRNDNIGGEVLCTVC
ncbi:MAG: 30S ribosomal protein S8 [Proteobacteria bacterium]|jgi:small subunit ribosomal protein S8|nr:30S ribosomal protein S8 [Pseudomonadota bacterium]MBT5795384.1 30S ribosomal protein S8 [Deltaproteobacteria bacterium]